jgi:thiol-disulfide isomerase/thioredoxin
MMMKFPSAALSFAALCLSLTVSPVCAIEVGQPAPDIQLSGPTVVRDLYDLEGSVVYVDFWASWCEPCRQSFPWLNAMQSKYSTQGLQIVAINVDSKRTEADEFLAQLPAQFALAFDAMGESAKRFGVNGVPASGLIGPDGKVLHVHHGFREEDSQLLEDKFVAALAGANN